jgi:hypothetical protein
MTKITFGQITLEDPNKSLQELVQIYKGLFINDEFGLPLISTVSDLDDLDEDDFDEEDNDSEEEVEESSAQSNPQSTQGAVTNNNLY